MLGSIKHFDRKKYIDIIEFPKILFCLFLNLQRTNTSCTKLSFRVQSWMLIRRLFSFEVMQIIQGQKQQCIYKHAKLKWSHKSSLKNYKKKAVQGHFQRLCADKYADQKKNPEYDQTLHFSERERKYPLSKEKWLKLFKLFKVDYLIMTFKSVMIKWCTMEWQRPWFNLSRGIGLLRADKRCRA